MNLPFLLSGQTCSFSYIQMAAHSEHTLPPRSQRVYPLSKFVWIKEGSLSRCLVAERARKVCSLVLLLRQLLCILKNEP